MNDMVPSESTLLKEAIDWHDIAVGHAKDAVSAAIEAGKRLEQIHELHNGTWVKWAEENLPFSRRTADNYRQAYRTDVNRSSLETVSNDDQILRRVCDLYAAGYSEAEEERLQKDRKIRELLLAGDSQKDVKEKLQCGGKRVARVYESEVAPVWREIEWRPPHDLSIAAKALHCVKNKHLIASHDKNSGWRKLAMEECGVKKHDLDKAGVIERLGKEDVVKAVEEGAIDLNRGYEISRMAPEKQLLALTATDLSMMYELRAMVNRMANAKDGFTQNIKDLPLPLIADAADDDKDELTAFCESLLSVEVFCKRIRNSLTGGSRDVV